MKPSPVFPRHKTMRAAALLAAALVFAAPACAEELLLLADFDDQPLNQPIGTGGAVQGQPASVYPLLSAVVRDGVLNSRALAIEWAEPSSNAHTVKFRWLGGVEIRTGIVTISLTVMPGSSSRYVVRLRESTSTGKTFGGLLLGNLWPGATSISDANGSPVIPGYTWSPGEKIQIQWVYDMNAGTYDLFLDGTLYFDDRAHGVDMGDRGLGAILIGMDTSSAADSRIDVDDILVTWSGEGVFADGFETSN